MVNIVEDTTINMAERNTPNIMDVDFDPPITTNPKLNFQTPPSISSAIFGDNEKNIARPGNPHTIQTTYGDVQNLPTPIAAINDSALENNSLTTNSPTINDFVSMSTDCNTNIENITSQQITSLNLPKTRQRNDLKRNILSNTNMALDSSVVDNIQVDNVKIDQPKRFTSEFQIQDSEGSNNISANNTSKTNTFGNIIGNKIRSNNSNNSKLSSTYNFKPVDRVVSLPIYQNSILNTNTTNGKCNRLNLKIPKTEPIPEGSEKHEDLNDTSKSIVTYEINSGSVQCWEILYEIGSGSFSKVYLANDGITALKITDILSNKDINKSKELQLRIQNSLTRELEILKLLNHPNIINLVGTDYNNFELKNPINKITMAIEYCKGGDLYSFLLEKRSSISSELIRYIFSNIVSGVSYMHKMNICHRDIKLENILLKYSYSEILNSGENMASKKVPIAVLSDFGLSKQIDVNDPLLSTRCGSEDYVSPELLLGLPYDGKQNDCWSVGVVLYTMLENRLPFDPLPNERENRVKRNTKPSYRIAMISWSWYLMKDEHLGTEYKLAKDITKALLTKRNKRATIDDVKENIWCSPYIIDEK